MATRKLEQASNLQNAALMQSNSSSQSGRAIKLDNLFQENQWKPVATDYMNTQNWQAVNANTGLFALEANEQNTGIKQFTELEKISAPVHKTDSEITRKIDINTDSLWNSTARKIENRQNAGEISEQRTESLNAEISRLDGELSKLNKILEQKRAELNERKKELETKEQELNEAKAKLLQEEQKLSDIQNSISAKNKEKQDIQNKLEEKQNDLMIKFGQARNEALQKAQQEYDPEKDGDYNTYLAYKLAQVTKDPSISNEITELSNSLTGINNELNTLNSQLVSQQNIIKNVTQQVNSLQNEVFALKNTIAMLEIKVNDTENSIMTNEAAKTTVQNSLNTITIGFRDTAQNTERAFGDITAEDMQNYRNNIQHNRLVRNTPQLSPDILTNRHNNRETVHRAPLNTTRHEPARTINPDVPRRNLK